MRMSGEELVVREGIKSVKPLFLHLKYLYFSPKLQEEKALEQLNLISLHRRFILFMRYSTTLYQNRNF